jgi:hypothetical protein
MSSKVQASSNLALLTQEKHRLQTYCTYQEKLISYKFDELKRNFPEILTQEILPYSPQKSKDVGSILDFVNDFILRLLPAQYRESGMMKMLLKVVEAVVIRVVAKKKE